MKKTPLLLLAALLALAVSGCSTIDKRIQEKSAIFAALDPAVQEEIRKGMVKVGYMPDMVYIALGRPDQQRNEVSAKGEKTTWIYNTYFDEYAGTAHAGYRRVLVVDPRTKTRHVYLQPVYTNVYQERIEEVIRITFANGRVTVIEQAKP